MQVHRAGCSTNHAMPCRTHIVPQRTLMGCNVAHITPRRNDLFGLLPANDNSRSVLSAARLSIAVVQALPDERCRGRQNEHVSSSRMTSWLMCTPYVRFVLAPSAFSHYAVITKYITTAATYGSKPPRRLEWSFQVSI